MQLDTPTLATQRQQLADHLGVDAVLHDYLDPALLASFAPCDQPDTIYDVVEQTVTIRHQLGFHTWTSQRTIRRVIPRRLA